MISREFVLKNFKKKLLEAKRQNVREVKLSLQEMDDLGYILFELLSELDEKYFSEKPNNSQEDTELTISGGSFN